MAGDKSKEQDRGHRKVAQKEGRTGHFAPPMDVCHLKNSEFEQKFHKYSVRVVLRGDVVKDDSGSCVVFTDKGLSASQLTAEKKSPDRVQCAGQASAAAPTCTKSRNGTRSDTLRHC